LQGGVWHFKVRRRPSEQLKAASLFKIIACFQWLAFLVVLRDSITELGGHYAFEQPGGRRILTGDLSTVIPTAWSGSVRQGIRMQLPNAALIEASVGLISGRDGCGFSLGF
jgi:hypothetical protein